MTAKTFWAVPLLAMAACAPHGDIPVRPPAPVGAAGTAMVPGVVTIWRGVKVLAGTTNIDWSNASFGVSGGGGVGVPTLSFFNAMGVGQQCWLSVPVAAPNVPVAPFAGGVITLTIPAPPPAIGLSPWAATFDNVPLGHWSIEKPAITGGAAVSNAVAGTYAGLVFQASTAAGQVTIVDGTVVGCHA